MLQIHLSFQIRLCNHVLQEYPEHPLVQHHLGFQQLQEVHERLGNQVVQLIQQIQGYPFLLDNHLYQVDLVVQILQVDLGVQIPL